MRNVWMRRSAVERVFLDPVEASVDEQEIVAVLKAELDVGFVAVEVAVEDELIGSGACEGEIDFGVRDAALGEREGVLLRVDDRRVVGFGVVQLLRRGKVAVEDDAAPALVVGEEGRTEV